MMWFHSLNVLQASRVASLWDVLTGIHYLGLM